MGILRKIRGYDGAVGAVAIWSSWMIFTRFAGSSELSSVELTALRYLVAGVVLLPFSLPTVRKIVRQPKLLALPLLMGFPYMLLVSKAISVTPAVHAATFINSSMIVTTILVSWLFLKQKFSAYMVAGGLLVVAGLGLLSSLTTLKVEYSYYLIAGAMWAIYGVLLQRWKVSGFDAVITVSLGSLFGMAIPYIVSHYDHFFSHPAEEMILHGFFQGIVASIGAHIFFARAVNHLGAAKVSFLVPTVPLITGMSGAVFLNEALSHSEWLGVVIATLGIAISAIKPRKHIKLTPCKIPYQGMVKSFH